MEKLKLFVVGESSADPEKWGSLGAHAIVVAHDETEAEALAGGSCCGPATEIPMDVPVRLHYERAWEPPDDE